MNVYWSKTDARFVHNLKTKSFYSAFPDLMYGNYNCECCFSLWKLNFPLKSNFSSKGNIAVPLNDIHPVSNGIFECTAKIICVNACMKT